MNPHTWWYVSRASGMVATVLLCLTLIWGLLLSTGVIERRGLPAWLTDLHRHLAALTVLFVAVHLVALVGDSYQHFSWFELFVPFASGWKAGPVAWGVGAFWALVVVQASSLARRRIAKARWRRLHYLSYPVALMTALHAAQAGTDAANPVFRATSVTLIVALGAMTVFRVLYRRPRRTRTAARVGSAQERVRSTQGGQRTPQRAESGT